MHHLVVGKGQDKVFGKGVQERKGDILMVELAEVGVHLHVVEDIVHPSHVPLQVEAQAAFRDRMRYLGPGGGLLRDHQHIVMGGEDPLIELLQEIHGLQVLIAAVDIADPRSVLAAIVKIQHGGYGVYPQSVDVKHFQPEEGRRVEEGADFVPPIVKDTGTPVGVFSLAQIGIFIAGLSVKLIESEGVLREVGGYPVQNHAHTGLVELVDEIHQVVGCAKAAGGRKISGTLIAPGVVQRMLGDGQQLHMGKTHLLYIWD